VGTTTASRRTPTASPATQRRHAQQLRELERLTAQNSSLRRKILTLQDKSHWRRERDERAAPESPHHRSVPSPAEERRSAETLRRELRREKLAATIEIWQRRSPSKGEDPFLENPRDPTAERLGEPSPKSSPPPPVDHHHQHGGPRGVDEVRPPPSLRPLEKPASRVGGDDDDAAGSESGSIDALEDAALESSVDAAVVSDAMDPLLGGADDAAYTQQVEAYRAEIASLRAQLGSYDDKLDAIKRHCDERVRHAENRLAEVSHAAPPQQRHDDETSIAAGDAAALEHTTSSDGGSALLRDTPALAVAETTGNKGVYRLVGATAWLAAFWTVLVLGDRLARPCDPLDFARLAH